MANQNIEKKYIAIKKEDFEKSRFKKFDSYKHAAYDSVMPIVIAEVNAMMLELPLVFMKNESKEKYGLFAISSLIPGVNLLVDSKGAFKTNYVPAYYRVYPFLFATAENGEKILCMDENSGLLVKRGTSGEPFFGPDGNVSAAIQEVIEFMQSISEYAQATQKAIQMLDNMDLIVSWTPKVVMGDKEQVIEGVYGINENKFATLKGTELVKLRDCGALQLAYAQMFSKQNLHFIGRLTQGVIAAQQKSTKNIVDGKGDLNLEFLNQDTVPV